MVTARIIGLGAALPGGPIAQDALWDGFFARHHGGGRLAARIFRDAGVTHRQAVANPLADDDVTLWSTGDRMRRYATESVPLGKGAVAAALADAELTAEDVGLFAVASCTGYEHGTTEERLRHELDGVAGCGADAERAVVS